ncbi:hypothetical protein D3C78_1604920 [compost metagenome]
MVVRMDTIYTNNSAIRRTSKISNSPYILVTFASLTIASVLKTDKMSRPFILDSGTISSTII